MLKMIGCILIILSGIGIGRYYCEKLRTQNRQLKQIKKMILLLKGEINYHRTYLSRALSEISGKLPGAFQDFLQYVSAEADANDKKTFAQIWEEGIKKHLSQTELSESQQMKLAELGSIIGYLDMDMQNAGFELFLEQLDLEIKESGEKLKTTGKVYQYLGLTGGVVTVLIII